MLHSSDLSLTYKGGRPLHFKGLELKSGARAMIIGPSGCGKTTLLSMLAGLLKPESGSVKVEGQELYALSPRLRDRLRGRMFGFVFQTMHLLPFLTLRQNIAQAAHMAGLPVDEARLEGLLQRLGLADKAQRMPQALSQGETQRGAIARAVLNRPKIILADEPTSALDDVNAQAVIELLLHQAQEANAALLVATHDGRIAKHFSQVISLREQVFI